MAVYCLMVTGVTTTLRKWSGDKMHSPMTMLMPLKFIVRNGYNGKFTLHIFYYNKHVFKKPDIDEMQTRNTILSTVD